MGPMGGLMLYVEEILQFNLLTVYSVQFDLCLWVGKAMNDSCWRLTILGSDRFDRWSNSLSSMLVYWFGTKPTMLKWLIWDIRAIINKGQPTRSCDPLYPWNASTRQFDWLGWILWANINRRHSLNQEPFQLASRTFPELFTSRLSWNYQMCRNRALIGDLCTLYKIYNR